MVAFVDQVQVFLRAGKGGDGCCSIKREKFRPLAGPDGGNGGNGGDIIVQADPQVTTLLEYHYRPHRDSENGGYGAGNHRNGKHGKQLVLPVPVGTVIKTESGEILADLLHPGDEYLAASGGLGGLGNAALASPKRKAPGFALLGTSGDACDLIFELKVVADVALVGFPSAGKSSLISAVSAAKPKIADYPFTTLQPNLGVVQQGNHRFTIADIPGLIEGASTGKGLGLEFLRHVERCTVLAHVIDCATLEPGRDPVSDLEALIHELESYEVPAGQKPLPERPQLIVLNKIDVPEARELAEFVTEDFRTKGYRVFQVSSLSHEGLPQLCYALGKLVDAARAESEQEEPERAHIVLKPKQRKRGQQEFEIRREGGSYGFVYRILGRKPERWVEQTDFTNDEAVGYLADRFYKLGVEEALVKAGATAGASVVVGPGEGIVFDWEPTVTSAAEVQLGVRGTDERIDPNLRRTNKERRVEYHERMDAKALAREELNREREAGLWQEDS